MFNSDFAIGMSPALDDLQFGMDVLGHFYFTKFFTPTRWGEGISRRPHGWHYLGAYVGALHYSTFKDISEWKKLSKEGLNYQSKLVRPSRRSAMGWYARLVLCRDIRLLGDYEANCEGGSSPSV